MPFRPLLDRDDGELPCAAAWEWHLVARRLLDREGVVQRGFLPQHQHAVRINQRVFRTSLKLAWFSVTIAFSEPAVSSKFASSIASKSASSAAGSLW